MNENRGFTAYHPLTNLIFFTMVIGLGMFIMHPVSLCISLIASASCMVSLKGRNSLGFSFRFVLPMMLTAVVINTAFNHRGSTILCYLPTGNPLTLESIVYGIAAAFMLASCVCWFSCFSQIIDSDKLIYLFGRIIPTMGLLVSMALRFVPRFIAQFKKTAEAQKALGRKSEDQSLAKRIKNFITIISIMITYSLENAVETADSMRSRGYGTGKRSSYSEYRFSSKDGLLIIWFLLCFALILLGISHGCFKWTYYPVVKGSYGSAFGAVVHAVYFLLCITPAVIEVKEGISWKKP